MNMYSDPSLTFGRDKIYSYEPINSSTVVRIIEKAIPIHRKNVDDIDWLFQLYRGEDTRILNGKEQMSTINHKVVVSQESAIVDVKAGLLTQNPVTLINRSGQESLNADISMLSNMYNIINKHRIDKECSGKAGICGVSYVFTEKDILYNPEKKNGHYPFKKSILNPTSVFPLWGEESDSEPLAMVYITHEPKAGVSSGDITGSASMSNYLTTRYTVYTDILTYSFTDEKKEVIVSDAMPWGIPIVEKYCNPYRIGFFERVESLIYARSVLRSDEMTNISSFVNAIWYVWGITIPSIDAAADQETQAKQQHAQEQFLNLLREKRMLWNPEAKTKAESGMELVGSQIDSGNTQILDETLRNDIIALAKVPDYVANIGGSGNGIAAQTASGWLPALLDAIDQEPYWFDGLRRELYIDLSICQSIGMFENLSVEDIDFSIQRKTFDDKQSAAQTFAILKNNGIPWENALDIANITPDAQNLAAKMVKWRDEEEKRGEVMGAETTEKIVTEDESETIQEGKNDDI